MGVNRTSYTAFSKHFYIYSSYFPPTFTIALAYRKTETQIQYSVYINRTSKQKLLKKKQTNLN